MWPNAGHDRGRSRSRDLPIGSRADQGRVATTGDALDGFVSVGRASMVGASQKEQRRRARHNWL